MATKSYIVFSETLVYADSEPVVAVLSAWDTKEEAQAAIDALWERRLSSAGDDGSAEAEDHWIESLWFNTVQGTIEEAYNRSVFS